MVVVEASGLCVAALPLAIQTTDKQELVLTIAIGPEAWTKLEHTKLLYEHGIDEKSVEEIIVVNLIDMEE